jgi:regulator of replication initiation timing
MHKMSDITEEIKQRTKSRAEPEQALRAIDAVLYESGLNYEPDRALTIQTILSSHKAELERCWKACCQEIEPSVGDTYPFAIWDRVRLIENERASLQVRVAELLHEIEKGRQWNQLLELEMTNLRAIRDDSVADWREDAKGWAQKSQEHAAKQDQREADFCHGFASGLQAAAESLGGGGAEPGDENASEQSGANSDND